MRKVYTVYKCGSRNYQPIRLKRKKNVLDKHLKNSKNIFGINVKVMIVLLELCIVIFYHLIDNS